VDLDVVEEYESIMSRSMERVTGTVLVSCESTLSTCWSKVAVRKVRDGKMLAWSPEGPASGA
jgi:hypothetical protein